MTTRVLHVLPHTGGGGERYVDFLERLEGFEHERFYLSAGRTPAAAAASIPRRWGRLARRVRSTDLIHCHGEQSTAIVLPLLPRRAAVMTTHGLHLFRRTHGVAHAALAGAIRGSSVLCDTLICTSAAERDELWPVVGEARRRKLRVIYNGIDAPVALDGAERGEIRAELGADPDAVLGLFVGQLEARKAPLLAVRAAAEARAAGAPFVLAMVGDGPQETEVRQAADDGTRVLGFQKDVGRLLGAADIFIQASEREGLSYALLDAMGHGLAVVASDGPGNPEAVGDAGLLFPAGDREGLVASLIRLVSNQSLRTELGGRAAARVRERFTTERFLAETGEIYRRAIGELTAPAPTAAGSPA